MFRSLRLPMFLFLCSVLFVNAMPVSQAQAQQDFKDVDSIMSQLMSLYDIPGAGLALVKDGKVFYSKGYGYRDTTAKTPVTENTLFSVGSVTKSFTAMDVVELVDAGKLDLDTPVIKYIPDLKLSDPKAAQVITLRELLDMSSGLARSDIGFVTGQLTTREQTLADIPNIPITAEPGKQWQYSNQSYVLAAYAAEKVSGQTWEALTQQGVFDPLGLKTANFNADGLKNSTDAARPHALDVLKGQLPIDYSPYMEAAGPAGAINASAVDMAKYMLFQLGDGTVNGKQLVSPEMMKAMHSQQIAIGTGPEADLMRALMLTDLQGYGFGWMTEQYRGLDMVQHDGVVNGFQSTMTIVPAKNIGVTILVNTSGANPFLEVARLRLIEWMLGLKSDQDLADTMNTRLRNSDNTTLRLLDPVKRKEEWDKARAYKLDPVSIQPLLGDYDSPSGKITLALRDGQVHLLVGGQKPQDVILVPLSPDTFLLNAPLAAGVHITFKTDDKGTITVYQEGVQVGQRPGKGVTATAYKDPKGRFTATIPIGLVAQQVKDFVVINSTSPAGTFFMAAADARSTDLQAEVKKWLTNLDPTFKLDPTSSNPVNMGDARTWKQFIFQLPTKQILAVVATVDKGTIYLVGVQGDLASVQALTPAFKDLLVGFKITQ